MDRTQAAEFLAELFAGADPAPSPAAIDRALLGARIPDTAGVWPGGEGYSETVDEWWAAADIAAWQALRASIRDGGQTITRFTSEGATFEVAGSTDWGRLSEEWRRRSIIGRTTGAGGLGVLEVDGGGGYVPTSQEVRSWT